MLNLTSNQGNIHYKNSEKFWDHFDSKESIIDYLGRVKSTQSQLLVAKMGPFELQ